MARRRREISFPLVLVLSRCFVFVFVCVSSSGFFTTINLCKEYERKLTAFDGGVSVRFTRWPPFDVSAAESLLSPRLDPISGSTGRSLLPPQCLPPHTSYLHGVSRDDAVDQTWGLYRSGKQTKPDLALRPPSRYKPTENHSATNPATEFLHQPNEDAAGQIWRLNRSGKQTKSDPASISDQAASSMSSRNLLFRRRLVSTTGETKGKTLISLVGSFFGMGLSTVGPQRYLHRPIYNSIGQNQNASWPRFACFYLLPKPNLLTSRYFAEVGRRLQFHIVLTLMVSLDKYHRHLAPPPLLVSTASSSLRAGDSTKREIASRQCICLRTLEIDWKKAQVDSKKILAQPHQSATTSPESTPPARHCKPASFVKRPSEAEALCIYETELSLQNQQSATIIIKSDARAVFLTIKSKKRPINLKRVTEASLARKPPITMIGIIRDILSIVKSFYDLSFRFILRSDTMFVDDLARTAVRSMTIGHNISLYFCFF